MSEAFEAQEVMFLESLRILLEDNKYYINNFSDNSFDLYYLIDRNLPNLD